MLTVDDKYGHDGAKRDQRDDASAQHDAQIFIGQFQTGQRCASKVAELAGAHVVESLDSEVIPLA